MIGKTLQNRYNIVKLLGSGGFGDTYLATDLHIPVNPKPQCVVKQLKPKKNAPTVLAIAKRLFEREARILYQLGKENNQIPKLFAHFEDNGEFYLVQEFIDGHDLTREIINGKPLIENVVWKLLHDILEVLIIVHRNNIIHRDIKPQNIMRRHKDGEIVLIDFGAVKEIGALGVNAQSQTNLTVAIGTPGYMPSEQAKGKPKLCSDIYAVGMLGIQALTGIIPNELKEDPTTGEIIWRNFALVSDKLADVIDVMVRDNFSQRYQSAALALQALNSTVALQPLSPIRPLPLPRKSSSSPPTVNPIVSPPIQPSSTLPTVVEKHKGSFKNKLLVGATLVFVGLGGYGSWLTLNPNNAKPYSSTQTGVQVVGKGYYRLQLKNNGKYLDADGCSDQVKLKPGTDYANGACQLWRFVPASGEYYRLQLKNSNKFLDATGCSDQVKLIGSSYHLNSACQLWRFVPADFNHEYYRLQLKLNGKYLDATNGCSEQVGLKPGSDYADGACQLWRFVPESI